MAVVATYPNALVTFTTKTDKIDVVDDDHINKLQVEVVAVETELGTNIKGSAADLKARLAVCLGTDGAIQGSTGLPGSAITGQLFYRTDEDVLYIYDGAAWDGLNAQLSNAVFSFSGHSDRNAKSGMAWDSDGVISTGY